VSAALEAERFRGGAGEKPPRVQAPPGDAPAGLEEPWGGLSRRETEVLELLARRLSRKEIAERLGLAPDTVKTYTRTDLRDEPSCVETLPRRGYRFVHEGRTYLLAAGVNLIGRDPGALLCLDASSVSRRHAEIVVSDGTAALRDLASKNGTFHGEARVRHEVLLADGDEIRIGTVRVQFRAAARDSTVTASSQGDRTFLFGALVARPAATPRSGRGEAPGWALGGRTTNLGAARG